MNSAYDTHLIDLENKPLETVLSGYGALKRKRMGRQVNLAKLAPRPVLALSRPYSVLDAVLTLQDGKFQPVSAENLRHFVCVAFGVCKIDFISTRRSDLFVNARSCFVWLARKHTKLPYTSLARFMGDRDHSTLTHGFKKFDRAQDHFIEQLTAIRAEIDRV